MVLSYDFFVFVVLGIVMGIYWVLVMGSKKGKGEGFLYWWWWGVCWVWSCILCGGVICVLDLVMVCFLDLLLFLLLM